MTHDEAREFVERWKKAGPALDKVRREELRNVSDDECREQFHTLLELASHFPQKRTTSGLVEQQRIFHRKLVDE